MPAETPLRGVIAPILTPFEARSGGDGIAADLCIDHARRVLAAGCAGIVPFGTTGEALSVGIEERMAMLEALVDAGIEPARMIPGTGLTNLPDTARLTRHAVDLGCKGAMVLPPFYFKDVPDDGIHAYFARLIERVGHDGLRVYLYHIPQVAGVGIPLAVARRLRAEFPAQIVGIKDSSGVWENTAALLEIDGLTVYPGAELPLIEALERGAAGCITATANVNAGPIAEVIRTWDGGDREGARARHQAVRAFRTMLQDYAPIPAMKRLLALSTGDRRWAAPRPPLRQMPAAEGEALAARLAGEFGFHAAA